MSQRSHLGEKLMLSRSRHAIIIAFTGTLLALVPLAVHAQKPALTQNIDEKGRTPFHETANCATYNTRFNGYTCVFQVVPAGYRLVVTHASAQYYAPNLNLNYVYLAVDVIEPTGYQKQEYLPLPGALGTSYFVVSSPVTFYVDAGEIPLLVLNDGSPVFGNTNRGTIDGYLVALSQ
jgi:hypothetical protein